MRRNYRHSLFNDFFEIPLSQHIDFPPVPSTTRIEYCISYENGRKLNLFHLDHHLNAILKRHPRFVTQQFASLSISKINTRTEPNPRNGNRTLSMLYHCSLVAKLIVNFGKLGVPPKILHDISEKNANTKQSHRGKITMSFPSSPRCFHTKRGKSQYGRGTPSLKKKASPDTKSGGGVGVSYTLTIVSQIRSAARMWASAMFPT